MNTADILAALIEHYSEGGYLCYPELRIGTGFGKDADQRIDLWVICPLPSKAMCRMAFEIKATRSDWLRELKQPLKRRHALLLSNEFFIVAPPGIVRAEELPVEAGLIEVHPKYAGGLHVRHKAPWRDGHPPTWRFVAGLLRRDLREVADVLKAEVPE